MTTVGARSPRRRGSVAGRGRSQRPPTPPPPASPSRVGRVLHRVVEWSGWTKLAAMTTTVAAIAALWFTSQSLRATDNQYDLSRQIAVTDRFQKAVDQLTSDKIDIRLGGIYLLERLAKDSPADHSTVFAVLAAFLRTHTTTSVCAKPTRSAPVPIDVQAVLTVIGRRDDTRDDRTEDEYGLRRTFDLRQTCLLGAQLDGVSLTAADFTEANLSGTWLNSAKLAGAQFGNANLTGAQLIGAELNCVEHEHGGRLRCTDFGGANLNDANLTFAYLTDADLTDATLARADLTGVNLLGANLTGANLVGADLTDAQLTYTIPGAGSLNADLTDIYYDHATRWPDGYTPPKSRPNIERK
ncbi:pentapeptide repeat-containing protein [Nocardia vinacea]|uniref:pentapeptide repeat-containing protein n=1 Tax=Nocardia vinacea TaxID=96468 RepID=UPI00340F51D3